METKVRKFISWGYRCTSSEMWKRLGKKEESYPFDWMISRLPVIRYHIETDFKNYTLNYNEAMKEYNYKEQPTQTAWYDSNGQANIICNEKVQYNTAFSVATLPEHNFSKDWVYGRDTYSYPMAFNHRDVFDNENQEYFSRCIGRWREIQNNQYATMIGLYVHPMLTLDEYAKYKQDMLAEYNDFIEFMTNTHKCKIEGVFIIPIRTDTPYPITQMYPNPLLQIVDKPQMKVCELYMNADAVDAGAAFYRNAYIEEDVLANYLSLIQ